MSTPVLLDTGDQAWMLTATALVQLMTPGVAFFYGGLVGEGNAVSTMMLCFGCMGVVSVLWSLIGYSIAFGPSTSTGVLGGAADATLDQLSSFTNLAYNGGTITQQLFASFQLMFAIITTAIIAGGVVGKIKWLYFLLFVAIWHLTVYCVLAHWIFYYDGWAFKYGIVDFAGGMVIHISSGVSAFVLAFWLGRGKPHVHHKPHNVPFVLLGAALLWFGWFGFNAGSALSAGYSAGLAFLNTQLGAAGGMLTWNVMEWVLNGDKAFDFKGRPTAVGAATGAVAGLVGITPGAGLVSPMWSIFIGFYTALSVYFFPKLLKRFTGVDDVLDVFAVHGIGGMVGSALTGLFTNPFYNTNPFSTTHVYEPDKSVAGPVGSFYGNPIELGKQCAGISVAILYAIVGTTIIYWLLVLVARYVFQDTIDIPVELQSNSDVSQHGEKAYHSKTTSVASTASAKPAEVTVELTAQGATA